MSTTESTIRGALARVIAGQNLTQSLQDPIDLLTGDHQGWCDSNHVLVSLLAQDSEVL